MNMEIDKCGVIQKTFQKSSSNSVTENEEKQIII